MKIFIVSNFLLKDPGGESCFSKCLSNLSIKSLLNHLAHASWGYLE